VHLGQYILILINDLKFQVFIQKISISEGQKGSFIRGLEIIPLSVLHTVKGYMVIFRLTSGFLIFLTKRGFFYTERINSLLKDFLTSIFFHIESSIEHNFMQSS